MKPSNTAKQAKEKEKERVNESLQSDGERIFFFFFFSSSKIRDYFVDDDDFFFFILEKKKKKLQILVQTGTDTKCKDALDKAMFKVYKIEKAQLNCNKLRYTYPLYDIHV
ncbi:hypothetical protein HMI54_013626 [Coelomomyces lativittatus]|nr:hypothetical protein HMI54_013626 [Coelomomyces lativittatus]